MNMHLIICYYFAVGGRLQFFMGSSNESKIQQRANLGKVPKY